MGRELEGGGGSDQKYVEGGVICVYLTLWLSKSSRHRRWNWPSSIPLLRLLLSVVSQIGPDAVPVALMAKIGRRVCEVRWLR